ncbi:MAG: hypothetical protein IPJ76_05790 [Flavobacteriales bacterium]|nr:MAG: hypothetical protein IPJ76_05790 [Flavobacteriales bacterium]
MKGINILYDAKGRKQQLQIDISLIEKNPEMVEDILDVLVCESRRNEPAIPLAELKRRLAKPKKH